MTVCNVRHGAQRLSGFLLNSGYYSGRMIMSLEYGYLYSSLSKYLRQLAASKL